MVTPSRAASSALTCDVLDGWMCTAVIPPAASIACAAAPNSSGFHVSPFR